MTDAAKCPVCDWEIGADATEVGGVAVCSDECARSEEQIQVIRRIYDAFAVKDLDVLLSHFHGEIEWIVADSSPLADGNPYRGLDALREQVFTRILAVFDFAIRPDEWIVAGDRVIMMGYYDGALAGSGKPFRAQVAHIWTLRDGKVTRFQQYLDTLRVAQALRG